MREQVGHGEADTVVSRQSKVCVAVLVERKSRFFIVVRIKDRSAAAMSAAVTEALGGLPPESRKTITYDNGLENAPHDSTNLELGAASFFAALSQMGKREHRKP
jgi:IS30 family transposase